eukprot:CAMPEP_0119340648 /NCGR_PEP_ID=MMETSP1333-20130426/100780_1 /TAXON_ID=418940 /ORGANISM="Scyphosphaera apsteinii, Strain RCC1455" /LENGTH=234 /DNA_ID=CAMNT_0007352449 /DNA_START=119 /DNA_END=819 /DNA_ORIENTATION=+
MSRDDILTTPNISVVLLDDQLWVGCVAPEDLPACAYPLLQAMLGAPDDKAGFFSLTHEEDGITLMMDDRCQRAFAETSHLCSVNYAPHRWRAFEIHLGTLTYDEPGVVCFLTTTMAERHISILNLCTYDRDFLLVAESDVHRAKEVIQACLQVDVDGLREAMLQLDVRRSHSSSRDLEDTNGSSPLRDKRREQLAAAVDGGGCSCGTGTCCCGATASMSQEALCCASTCKLPTS